MILKQFLLISVFLFSFLGLSAQSKLEKSEQILKDRFDELKVATTDSMKLAISKTIGVDLKKTLKEKGSFEYPFDKLQFLGKVISSDQKLRVFSWNCVLNCGRYQYFSIIQKKIGRKFELFELHHNFDVKEDMTSQFSEKEWLGALYYQIVPFKSQKETKYLLLGWDGGKDRTNKKLIEVLSFSKTGDVVLGAPVINWRGKRLSRVIFEYSKQVQMTLKFYEKTNLIVFDHLSPAEPRYINQFEYYGPDFSYDALEFKEGVWYLIEEFDSGKLD